MPEKSALLTFTFTQIACDAAERLSKGSLNLPTSVEKGELTFASQPYKMKAQPAQWTPQMMRSVIPAHSVRMAVRSDEIDV